MHTFQKTSIRGSVIVRVEAERDGRKITPDLRDKVNGAGVACAEYLHEALDLHGRSWGEWTHTPPKMVMSAAEGTITLIPDWNNERITVSFALMVLTSIIPQVFDPVRIKENVQAASYENTTVVRRVSMNLRTVTGI